MIRRALAALGSLTLASAAMAATPYFLDHGGTLWQASAMPDGVVLSGQRNGVEVFHSVVPFALPINGAFDSGLQVVADDVTGAIVVVWQRTWAKGVSEILGARWQGGDWSDVQRLSGDVSSNPRNPEVRLSTVSSTTAAATTAIVDSFVEVLWWEDDQAGKSHGVLDVIRLTGDDLSLSDRSTYNLSDFIPLYVACPEPPAPQVLEHPLFAATPEHDRALVLFSSAGDCFFYLLDVHFALQADNNGTTNDPPGPTLTAERRRHMPIFGVKKVFLAPQSFDLSDARVVMGADLNPVAYRVQNGQITYVVNQGLTWSAPRTLPTVDGLTLDQAIPLVENLAR